MMRILFIKRLAQVPTMIKIFSGAVVFEVDSSSLPAIWAIIDCDCVYNHDVDFTNKQDWCVRRGCRWLRPESFAHWSSLSSEHSSAKFCWFVHAFLLRIVQGKTLITEVPPQLRNAWNAFLSGTKLEGNEEEHCLHLKDIHLTYLDVAWLVLEWTLLLGSKPVLKKLRLENCTFEVANDNKTIKGMEYFLSVTGAELDEFRSTNGSVRLPRSVLLPVGVFRSIKIRYYPIF